MTARNLSGSPASKTLGTARYTFPVQAYLPTIGAGLFILALFAAAFAIAAYKDTRSALLTALRGIQRRLGA